MVHETSLAQESHEVKEQSPPINVIEDEAPSSAQHNYFVEKSLRCVKDEVRRS